MADQKAGAKRAAALGALDQEEDGKRQRQRRDKKGDQLRPNDAATLSRVQADTPATLFEGGLHLVFSFLGADEQPSLRPAWIREQSWLACRRWYAAAQSMRSKQLWVKIRSHLDVASVVGSSLGYHFTRLELDDFGLDVVSCSSTMRDRVTEINFISTSTWLIREVSCYAPLVRLPKLDALSFLNLLMTPEHLAVVKQLSLRKLILRSKQIESIHLTSLLTPPHALHNMQEFHVATLRPTGEMLEQIVTQLPQLTHLVPGTLDRECMPHLGQLRHLRVLDLKFQRHGRGRFYTFSSEIAPHLAAFGQLRSLSLESLEFERSKDLTRFFEAMPHLERLILESVRLPANFKGFGHGRARALETLSFNLCSGVTFESLCQLSTCTSLRHLILHCTTVLTRGQIALLETTPHSKRLPHLERFVYYMPEYDE